MGRRWVCMVLAVVGQTVALMPRAEAGDHDPASPAPASMAPERIETVEVALTGPRAAEVAAWLERVFGVGAGGAPWQDGLRTMADLPAVSVDIVNDATLRLRAPAGELALVTAMARALDESMGTGGLVRVFRFERSNQGRGAAESMTRLAESGLMPGAGVRRFEAPGDGKMLIALAPPAAHPMIERMARDFGGAQIELAALALRPRNGLERHPAQAVAQRAPIAMEPRSGDEPVVALKPDEPSERAPLVTGEITQASVGQAQLAAAETTPPALDSQQFTIEVPAEIAQVEASHAAERAPVTMIEAPPLAVTLPRIAAPEAPKTEAIAALTPAPTLSAVEQPAPIAVASGMESKGAARVVRVVPLLAADAAVIAPRMQQAARAVFDDVQVLSAEAGNALLVVGWPDEADACVSMVEEVDAAAARLTEDAMLVLLDEPGAEHIASTVQRVLRRPGGELGLRIAGDDARGAIALTGPREVAGIAGGLAEALARTTSVEPAAPTAMTADTVTPSLAPPLAPPVALPVTSAPPAPDIAINRPQPTVPSSPEAARTVVVRPIRPPGGLHHTAELAQRLLERAGLGPVRVLNWQKDEGKALARRKLLVPQRIRLIIKYSQSTLARLESRDARMDEEHALDQVFASPEPSPSELESRLELIVLPDRKALALIGSPDAVAHGAAVVDALSNAAGLDRIEIVELRHARAPSMVKVLRRVLGRDDDTGPGQVQLAADPRLNVVVITGPAHAALQAAALARELDRPGEHSDITSRKDRELPSEPADAPAPAPAPAPTPPIVHEAVTAPPAPPAMADPTHAMVAVDAPVIADGPFVFSARSYVVSAPAWKLLGPQNTVALASADIEMLLEGLVARGEAARRESRTQRSWSGVIEDEVGGHALRAEARTDGTWRLTGEGRAWQGMDGVDLAAGDRLVIVEHTPTPGREAVVTVLHFAGP